MTATEHIAKSAYMPKAGVFALLRGLLGVKGGGGRSSARRMEGLGACMAVLLTLVIVPACASAETSTLAPWWHVTSGSRPTYLPSGTAEDEVQELAVTATSGSVVVVYEKQPAEFAYDATHHEAQVALEGVYGSGNVEVSEPTRSGTPFVVTFKGALAYRAVGLMNTEDSSNPFIGKLKNGGVPGTVVVTQRSQGRDSGEIVLTAENLGDAPVTGERQPVKVRDVLPAGFEAFAISGRKKKGTESNPLVCDLGTLSCEWSGVVPPYTTVEVFIPVVIKADASSGEANPNHVSVTGGEGFQCDAVAAETGKFSDSFCTAEAPLAHGGFERVATGATPTASLARPLVLTSQPTPFGVENYELLNEEEGGAAVTQAGAHPFQQTTIVELNQTALAESQAGEPDAEPAGLAKDLNFNWPAGLIGNATAVPQCTGQEFLTLMAVALANACPSQAAVGVVTVTIDEPFVLGFFTITVPLFNLEPRRGEPARFGFYVPLGEVAVYIDTSVRTGGDYGVTVSTDNITQTAAFLTARVTVWGVPGDARHDASRGWGCLAQSGTAAHGTTPPACEPPDEPHPSPLLSLPTACTGPLQSTVDGDSWEELPLESHLLATYPMPSLSGCNQLPFAPELKVKPDGGEASKPTGLEVDVHVPQEVNDSDGEGLASSNVKDIEVTLPEGVTLNPAAADGLEACSEAQVGFEGGPGAEGELLFSSTLPEAFCPDAAKVGTVSIESPLLPKGQPLQGAVYLATPAPNAESGRNPFNSLVAMYIVAEAPISGTLVKLPGEVTLNQATGRIEATFENTPQLAFENANIHFFGGERAPLATPAHCGTYTTEATFTPWSGNPPVKSTSSFEINSGPNGSACAGTLPFSPSLASGTTNINAGSFSPLDTTISREDGQQNIQNVTLHYPPGVSGILSGIPLCGEQQANEGTCGSDSQIGETIVSVGLGGDPYTVTGGKVYLTGPYQGAPFGLSIVNPAVAGPFNLGTVVVRAKIEINPFTAALTITTGVIPHILDGIPLQIKHVNVNVNRPGFTFNPTNCRPTSITGAIGSVEGASSPVSVPFQVTNCASLKFAPKFSVSIPGHTSKAIGAGLTAKLSYPAAAQGTQADIAKVKVSLPVQLPSQLKTLQKACLAATFEANPANCPEQSIVGHATVTTPLLPVPLKGPAYFVSHAGEEFPSLTMVLQGYGVTVDLVGSTYISKAGITSTTFKTVPDVPFNNFELTLPQGKYAALGVNLPAKDDGSYCGQKLVMPTEFLGQNGAEIEQSTPITVSGCAKALTRTQKLTKALKACKKDHNKTRRVTCESRARKQYGSAKASKKGKKTK